MCSLLTGEPPKYNVDLYRAGCKHELDKHKLLSEDKETRVICCELRKQLMRSRISNLDELLA